MTLVRTPIIEDLPNSFGTGIPYQKGLILALETHYATQWYQGQSDDTQIRGSSAGYTRNSSMGLLGVSPPDVGLIDFLLSYHSETCNWPRPDIPHPHCAAPGLRLQPCRTPTQLHNGAHGRGLVFVCLSTPDHHRCAKLGTGPMRDRRQETFRPVVNGGV